MKQIRKMMVAVMMMCLLCISIPAQASGISPRYSLAGSVRAPLSISGTTAYCSAIVYASSSVTSIRGSLVLIDSSTGASVATWSVSSNGDSLNVKRTASVTKGHSYVLSFSGTVYSSSGSESVTVSSSGQCN